MYWLGYKGKPLPPERQLELVDEYHKSTDERIRTGIRNELVKLQRVTFEDSRYREVQRFARVLLNYYVSEEAPGRMQTTAARVSPEQEYISMSQGDEPNYDRKTTHRRYQGCDSRKTGAAHS